jgi:hypothetical protein
MEGCRERVEVRLSGLEVVYGSFPVDQTTISVPERQFERFYERGRKEGGAVGDHAEWRSKIDLGRPLRVS